MNEYVIRPLQTKSPDHTPGCGGIIGDKYNYGNWIKYYSKAICIATSIITELRGLRDRLIFSSQLQLDAIKNEQAAKVAVCLIKRLNHLVNLLLLLMIVGIFIGLGKQVC